MEVLVSGLGPPPSSIRKTYVVLPAYNEAASLARLIPRIAQQLGAAKRPFEVLVVNDGSSDDTSAVLHALPMKDVILELRHEHNQGYGAALKTAFLWIAENANADDAAVALDADNTHDPLYIPSLLHKLEKGCDAATASYTMPGGHASGVPWGRRLMSSFLNAAFHYAAPLPGVKTYTNGFRAYRASAVKSVHRKYGNRLIEETGFPGGTEFFLKIAGLRGTLAEVPFDLHYEQRGAESKIRLYATIRKYLHLLVTGGRYVHP